MLLSAAILLSVSSLILAQDLSIPTTWRKPNSSEPRSSLTARAQRGVDAILTQLNASTGEFSDIGTGWQAANIWSAIANEDYLANSTRYKTQVTAQLNLAFAMWPDFDEFGYFNDDSLWWAQAAVYGYRAYGDTNLLSHAVSTWNRVSQFVITPEAAKSGSLPGKSFNISGSCEGNSMIGGVFWRPTSDDQGINSITTGEYMTLSAFLAEITQDEKYTSAAILSAQWIKNINLNPDGIVLDGINGVDCSRSPANWLFTYNSGKYIEGLSVLADVTADGQWRDLMINVTAAAVKSTAWQGDDGIITEGASSSENNDGVGFKAIFVRGLTEAFLRQKSNATVGGLISSYIDVQYNALIDLASSGDSYSSSWHDPAQNFTTWGQLAALDLLGSAIAVN